MDINLHAATLALARQGVTTLADARGARIVAVSGLFWITQDGDPRDYMLAAGEDLEITTDGAVVIEAQVDARFALLEPAAEPRRRGRHGNSWSARFAALRAI
ncbi:MAG: DUF2917 domain-containing protein [Burkholderiales bacterium]|nr:DUF2917 domain-containing protein [Burkholderiales bacterium]